MATITQQQQQNLQQTWSTADFRRLRGILAERRITRLVFARACGLNAHYLGRILCGTAEAGELARFKIAQGIRALHLDGYTVTMEETPRAS